MGDGDGLPGPTDAWVTLGGLARETSTIRLGHAGDVDDVPTARSTCDQRRPGRRHVGRPRRTGTRRRLVSAGTRGLRHPLPGARRAIRSAGGATRDHHRHVVDAGRRDVRVTRRPLPGHQLAGVAEASAIAGADRDRGRRTEADTGARRSFRVRVQHAVRADRLLHDPVRSGAQRPARRSTATRRR